MPMMFTPENFKWARIAASQGDEGARRILQAWNRAGQAKRTAMKARDRVEAAVLQARRAEPPPAMANRAAQSGGEAIEDLVKRLSANWKTEARRADFRHVYGPLGL